MLNAIKRNLFINLYLLLPALFNLLNATPASATKKNSYGFIENKGQIVNQFNKPNKNVLYLYNANGFKVQLKKNSFSYELIKNHYTEMPPSSLTGILKNPSINKNTTSIAGKKPNIISHRIDISFIGSTKSNTSFTSSETPKIIASEPSIDNLNFYTTGNENGLVKIQHFKKIFYKNIWPHIDIEFVIIDREEEPLPGSNNNAEKAPFKYNIIVHPGANLNAVCLKIDGAISNSLTQNGHIKIETANGIIDESIPVSYQNTYSKNVLTEHKDVKAYYKKTAKNCYGFSAVYDHSKDLIIDPVPWCTYFGGTGDDRANSVTTDKLGNVIVTGFTSSQASIASSGAYQTSFGGNIDVFIVKYSNTGVRLWSTYYGGSDIENGIDIITDLNNNIIITGYTLSSSGISTTGSHQPLFEGGTTYGDGFVAKFSNAGVRLWATYYGGSEDDYSNGIITDPSGNIFLAGYTTSAYPSSSIATSGAHQTIMNNGPDAFLVKFTGAGIRQWGTYFGSVGPDYGCKLAIDTNGYIALAGITYSNSGIADSNAVQNIYGGNGDAFLARFNPLGNRVWCTYMGGSSYDYGIDISIDPLQNIIMAGSTNSSSDIATSGAYKSIKRQDSTHKCNFS